MTKKHPQERTIANFVTEELARGKTPEQIRCVARGGRWNDQMAEVEAELARQVPEFNAEVGGQTPKLEAEVGEQSQELEAELADIGGLIAALSTQETMDLDISRCGMARADAPMPDWKNHPGIDKHEFPRTDDGREAYCQSQAMFWSVRAWAVRENAQERARLDSVEKADREAAKEALKIKRKVARLEAKIANIREAHGELFKED